MIENGTQVGHGWVVINQLEPSANATGGHFSTGFIVEKNGARAFMKVIDVTAALSGPDPLRQVEAATRAFNFERDLLERCKSRNLSHVVTPIEDGQISRGPGSPPLFYIMFKAADGDMRRVIRAKQSMDVAWILRCMHGMCVGISQLHSADIAHQDLKPSNVLIDKNVAKIADLGRASLKGATTDHDRLICAGDLMYAPPEALYEHVAREWVTRRIACDIYHLGSMMSYMINGSNITNAVQASLHASIRASFFQGTYDEVVPYLRSALEDVLKIMEGWLSGEHGREIIGMIRIFCEPDPRIRIASVRGDRTGPLLEYFVARLDFLSRSASAGLLRIAKEIE